MKKLEVNIKMNKSVVVGWKLADGARGRCGKFHYVNLILSNFGTVFTLVIEKKIKKRTIGFYRNGRNC